MSFKIAYFMTDNDSMLSGKIYRAVDAYCRGNEDVEVSVFTCFGGISLKGSSQGEYEIIHLPHIEDYDGIIMHASQFQMPSVLDILIRKVYDSEAIIPLVSIDLPLKGADHIGTDNYAAMADLVTFLISECGCRKMAFVEGPMDNREAYERLRAFEDACVKAGITEEGMRFFDGNWNTDSGRLVIERLMKDRDNLPDALVCANDDMALGAIFACEEFGINIPGEMMISGFDDTLGARLFSPRLTTVNRNTEDVIFAAFDQIIRKITKKPVRPRRFVPYSLEIRESTGGTSVEREEDVDHLRMIYAEEIRGIHPSSHSLRDLMSRMFEPKNLRSLMELLEEYAFLFGAKQFYLFLNDHFVSTFGDPDALRSIHFDEDVRMMVCYPKTMEHDKFHSYKRFSRRELLPDEIEKDSATFCYYPIHYTEHCFGYIAMEFDERAHRDAHQKSALIMIAAAIENLHKRKQMNRLNRDLEHLYVKDALTGAYNRFGLDNEGEELYKKLRDRGEHISLYFFDIDDMKSINEDFGHDEGDACLTQAVGVLERSVIEVGAEEDSFIMRYGGDEFVVFGAGLGEKFEKAVIEGVNLMNRESFTPFNLNFTFEKVEIAPGDDGELEKYIDTAERSMRR